MSSGIYFITFHKSELRRESSSHCSASINDFSVHTPKNRWKFPTFFYLCYKQSS